MKLLFNPAVCGLQKLKFFSHLSETMLFFFRKKKIKVTKKSYCNYLTLVMAMMLAMVPLC